MAAVHWANRASFRKVCAIISIYLASCSSGAKLVSDRPEPRSPQTRLTVTDGELGSSPRFIVYGDMRFTDVRETAASQPSPRRSIIARIASEQPDAVFLTGDIPWHGGNEADYGVFQEETAAWRNEQLRVFPVLGNHEFKGCAEVVCLARWWQTFPQQNGRRWYTVRLGTRLQFFALDSVSSLLPGGEQGQWLQQQLDGLSPTVRFVVVLLHHPPITDYIAGARGNETALAKQLAAAAAGSRARFIVCAAHVHNYERFQRDGIVFLVSGGGGGKPEFVNRSTADLYQSGEFPNFHYLRFELTVRQLRGEMVRLSDVDAPSGPTWAVRDYFEVNAKTP
ncbi:MAG: hypothetical protein QOI59_5390 [Gammaproteobacteria bacterium]|jgi:hypothetical protein|nr:hypothetical protein [Gammaproteobacteria bacterium]